MPITRTNMIDDDGSGTTGTIINNAWKQEFYNQIDALAGTGVVPWTPTDASGAGLVFTAVTAYYSKVGRIVTIWADLTYPATAHSAAAQIGNFPVGNSIQAAGFYQTYGLPCLFWLGAALSSIYMINPSSGANYSNASLSGAHLQFSGSYFADI